MDWIEKKFPELKKAIEIIDFSEKTLEYEKAIEIIDSSYEFEMVFIQGGTFDMGSKYSSQAYNVPDDEKPIHSVTVSDFFIGNYEVTNKEYVKFLKETCGNHYFDFGIGQISNYTISCLQYHNGINNIDKLKPLVDKNFSKKDLENKLVELGYKKDEIKQILEYAVGFNDSYYIEKYSGIIEFVSTYNVKSGYEHRPVVCVTWYDAIEYCNWLSIQECLEPCYSGNGENIVLNISKKGYRLPTEAEWEYACRAGSTTKFYWENYKDYKSYCWEANSALPVGQKRPNAWGLYDMIGNVGEWCSDWYSKSYYLECDNIYYSEGPLNNPLGPITGLERVMRGKGNSYWNDDTRKCRSAKRYQRKPGDQICDVGFRLARTL